MKTPSPNIVNIGVVRGLCPANCIHCPVGETLPANRDIRFGHGFMEIEKFKSLCTEINEFVPVPCLRVHGVGEPALWAVLGEALVFAKNLGIKTWVFSMGLGQSREVFLENISHAGIVEFSINATDAEEFKNTKGLEADHFAEICTRIEMLSDRTPRPRILISRVQTKDKVKDEAFLALFRQKGWGDDVFIRAFHDYGERIADKDSLLTDRELSGTKRSCLVPQARMNIDGVLGVVVRCFNELFDTPEKVLACSVGRLLEKQTLKEIWEGGLMQRWRADTFAYEQCAKCRSCQPVNPNSSEHQLT